MKEISIIIPILNESENVKLLIPEISKNIKILKIIKYEIILVDDNSEDIWDFDKITLSDAKKIEEDFEIGDEVAEEIKIEDFGRRAVILAKQTLIQRVKDLEKEVIINKYEDLVGEVITGEIYQTLSREVLLVDVEGNEISLPRSEQIFKDKYRKGDALRGVVTSVDAMVGSGMEYLYQEGMVDVEAQEDISYLSVGIAALGGILLGGLQAGLVLEGVCQIQHYLVR